VMSHDFLTHLLTSQCCIVPSELRYRQSIVTDCTEYITYSFINGLNLPEVNNRPICLNLIEKGKTRELFDRYMSKI